MTSSSYFQLKGSEVARWPLGGVDFIPSIEGQHCKSAAQVGQQKGTSWYTVCYALNVAPLCGSQSQSIVLLSLDYGQWVSFTVTWVRGHLLFSGRLPTPDSPWLSDTPLGL